MIRKPFFVTGLTGFVIIMLLSLRGCRDKTQISTSSDNGTQNVKAVKPSQLATKAPQVAEALETKMNLLYLTPISFYGRVIDQHGSPVSGAAVEFSANTNPFGQGDKFAATTDNSGVFQVTGKHGRSLFVSVSKEGYYRIPSTSSKFGSSGSFAYGSDLGYGVHSPSKDRPITFILRKAGALEPLISRREIKVPLNPNGAKYPVSLRQSHGDDRRILLSCRSEPMPESGGAFDWLFEISVEEGELIERKGDFDFEAPLTGYHSSDSIEMAKTLPREKWKDRVSKSFFIRFKDGVVARVSLDIHAGTKPHVWLDSFLNPKSGSRNLEADPLQR